MTDKRLMKMGLFLLLIAFHSTAKDPVSASWDKYLKDLPQEARSALKKRLECNAFGGDQLEASEEKRWKKLGCDKSEQQLEALKKKFSKNDKVTGAIDCVENTISARNCP